MTETDIQQAIRLDLGREPDVLLYRNSVGATTLDEGVVGKFLALFPALNFARAAILRFVEWLNRSRTQRFGLCPGSSDLIGIGPGGRFLAIEVKTKHGRVAPEQARFIDLVRARGGIAGICRSVEDARALVQAAREGRA